MVGQSDRILCPSIVVVSLYIKAENSEAESDSRTLQEHYDSWRASSDMMKLSFLRLNSMLGMNMTENES